MQFTLLHNQLRAHGIEVQDIPPKVMWAVRTQSTSSNWRWWSGSVWDPETHDKLSPMAAAVCYHCRGSSNNTPTPMANCRVEWAQDCSQRRTHTHLMITPFTWSGSLSARLVASVKVPVTMVHLSRSQRDWTAKAPKMTILTFLVNLADNILGFCATNCSSNIQT